MENKISVKKNFLYNISYQLISALVPIILTPYIARVLTANGVGISSYITANVTYFQLFSFLGIAGHGQREIAVVRKDKEKVSRIFWELQLLHFLCGLIVLTIYIAFSFVIASKEVRVFYLINVVTLISSILDISWLYQGYECFRDIAIKNIIAKGSIVFFCMLFVKNESDLWLYVAVNALGLLASSIFLWKSIYQYVLPLHKIKKLNIFRHIKPVLIFFIPTIAASVYSILDKTVINIVTKSNLENGYYENAYKILTILNVAVQNLSTVMSPRMSNIYGTGNEEKMKGYLNSAIEMMLFIAMPLAFGMASISKNFVPLFLGAGWDAVIPLLYVFMPLVVVLGFSVYLDGMYLVPSGRRLQSATAICIGALINFVLNFVLVSYWKALGAAVATLITETLIAVIMIIMSRYILDKKRIIKAVFKYGIYGVIVFIVSSVIGILSNKIYIIIVQVIAGVVVYAVLLLVFKDEILKRVINSFKGRANRN